MSLREDFFDLAYELAQIVNEKIDRIEKKAKSTIEFYENKTRKQIHKDRNKLEKKMMYNELYELNVNESKQISQINQAVAEEKNRCIKDFINYLKRKISEKIDQNPEAYYEFLNRNLRQFFPIINQDIILYLNEKDLKYINNTPRFNKLQNNEFNIRLSSEPIDITAGYKIQAEDNSFEIDFSLEAQIEKHIDDFSMRFMSIFPVFEINVKNATELEKEIFGEKNNE